MSGVQDLIAVYRKLAAACDYPLHLGLTEAGMGAKGIVASTAAMAILLQEGIGDTIRVSLTPAPNGDRTEEVLVSQQILQSLGLRSFTPQVTACPGCGRTTSTFFQEMADRDPDVSAGTDAGVEEDSTPVSKRSEGRRHGLRRQRSRANPSTPTSASRCPGTSEEPKAPVYVDGRLLTTLRGDGIVEEFIGILDDYVARRFAH